MARELSQEELLDFLCQAGGRVTNAALLGHFKRFLRDPGATPGQVQQRRELFKSLVNSVAAVRQDSDGLKCVVLKKRYRDLVGEDGLRGPRSDPQPSAPQPAAPQPSAPQPAAPQPSAPQPAAPQPTRPPGAPAASPGSRRRAPRQRQQQQPRSPQQPPRPQPQPQRARRQPREKKPETEPAGARATAPETECNGLLASPGDAPESTEPGREGVDCNPGRLREAATAGGPSPQARGLAQGGCPWADSTEPLLLSHGGPPLEELQALEPSSGGPPEGTPNSRPGSSTKPPPLTMEIFRDSGTSPSLASLAFPGDGSELLTLNGPYSYTAQQQQRTREWVANHSHPSPDHVAERSQQSPSRFWCVLPENFLSLPYSCGDPASERLPPSLPVSPPLLTARSSVFRSIRCQLDLQDLENFVEEDSHDSEESTSGPRESPGELEEAPKVPFENRAQEKLRTPSGHFNKSQQENTPLNTSQGPIFRSGYSLQYLPATVNDPVVKPTKESRESSSLPQDPMPCPTVRLKRSLRRSSRAWRDKISSSDEELLDEDLVRRNRRPPRSRKLSRAGAAPCPKVDAPLTLKPTVPKAASEQRLADSIWVPPGDVSSVLVSLRPSVHRSSLVPLDSREHEWIVRIASGSWRKALTLFWEDPQLALRKDFLTGYTALHWIAKHGALHALQELVKGAQKAGIVLDVNVRSSCGYTPLHLAALHGHHGIIKLLVQKLESRVNVRDSSGKKPWQYLTSNTTGEIWQLLGAPRGKPIFPVHSLVSSSPPKKTKSHDVSRHISRKTSLAALLKSQHNRWKMTHQYDKFRTLGERDEYSD